MITVRSTLPRRFLMVSLVLSLSMSGLYPQVMARSGWTSMAETSQSSRVCCCGTKDGRCCGMACCQRAIPKPDNAPTSPNRCVERGQPLALLTVNELHGDGSDRGAFRYANRLGSIFEGSISLVASSVRLNV